MSSEAGLPASFCLEPASKTKKILSIEVLLQAFHIFVGLYTQKFPHEAPALMKYGQTIRDLALHGQNWRFYDENFRFLRQTQCSLVPWGSIHSIPLFPPASEPLDPIGHNNALSSAVVSMSFTWRLPYQTAVWKMCRH